MDPGSIVGLVAACSSLAKQCTSVVKTLHELAETYKHADLTILSIATECETIQFAWKKIGAWVEENIQSSSESDNLGERLQKSIYCGELVLSALEEEVTRIITRSPGFKRKIGVLWNNGVFNEHQSRLRGQVAALQLLLQVLSMPLREDRAEVLIVKDKIFSDADESALSIVPTDRSTRNSLEGNRLSLISDDGDVQYIRFSFEDALFTSHVYKRNYRFLLRQPSQPVETNRAAKEMSHDNSNLVPDATVLPNAATALRGEADDWFPAADISKSVAVSKHGPQDEDKSRPDTAVVAVSFARKKDLIQALSQANVAVLRDNMSDLEGAVVCYQASCNILDQIVVVTKVKTDRDKVIAIRKNYQDRIVEIQTLLSADSQA